MVIYMSTWGVILWSNVGDAMLFCCDFVSKEESNFLEGALGKMPYMLMTYLTNTQTLE